MTIIYLAKFESPMYPEDNRVFAAYVYEADAQQRIVEECELSKACNPNHPDMYTSRLSYYSIDEIQLVAGCPNF